MYTSPPPRLTDQFKLFDMAQCMDQETQTEVSKRSLPTQTTNQSLDKENQEMDFLSDFDQEEPNVNWKDAMMTQDLFIDNDPKWTFQNGQLGTHIPKAILCQAVQLGESEDDPLNYCLVSFKHRPKLNIKVKPAWIPLFMMQANHADLLSQYYLNQQMEQFNLAVSHKSEKQAKKEHEKKLAKLTEVAANFHTKDAI